MKKFIMISLILSTIFLASGLAFAWHRHPYSHFRFGIVIVPPPIWVAPPPIYYRGYYPPPIYYGSGYYYDCRYQVWVPGHWEERWTPYGWETVWIPGYWRCDP